MLKVLKSIDEHTKDMRKINRFLTNNLIKNKDDNIKMYERAIEKAKDIISDMYKHKYLLKEKAIKEIDDILGN